MGESISFKKRRRKLVNKLGGKALWSLERFVEKSSKVPATPFIDPVLFPWTKMLEANWKDIRAEVDQILGSLEHVPNFQDISKDQKALTTDNNWKTFFLYGFGYKAEKNARQCPRTVELIEQIPGMTTAFFSILKPGKHIPEHRGVYKGFIRYHMGLKVPAEKEKCRIRVHDQYAHWEEGKSMMFDDTYQHEVWNDTGETRVVLFMDIIRPLRFPMNLVNLGLINVVKRTAFIQDAKKNQEAWEKSYERVTEQH